MGRSRQFGTYIVCLLGLLTLLLSSRELWSGCADIGPIDGGSLIDRGSLSDFARIYYFDNDGRFYRRELSSSNGTLISNRKILRGGILQISPNGRYIVHGNVLANESKDIYVLYNTKDGSEKLFFEMPAWDMLQAEFSPDSRKMAILNVSYPHRQSYKKEGIFIFDLNTMKSKFHPYPETAKIPQSKVMGAHMRWSRDGKYIYLAFNGHLESGHLREYHKLNIKNGRLLPATGYFDEKDLSQGYSFTYDGRPVDLHINEEPQSKHGYSKLNSKDNGHSAYVDSGHRLYVFGLDRARTLIASGRHDHCEGVTIRIIGWIGSNYLVYSNENRSYVFDVKSSKKYLLFDDEPSVYLWSEHRAIR